MVTTPSILEIESLVGPAVFSSRVIGNGYGWTLQKMAKAFDKRRRAARRMVDNSMYGAAIVTDVANYYGSIQSESLAALCEELRIPNPVPAFERHLEGWRRSGGKGLPIGPQTSGPLGNAYLVPTDRSLEDAGISIIRFSDDYLMALPPGLDPTEALAEFDSALRSTGLERSVPKTEVFEDLESAVAFAENSTISYLKAGGRSVDAVAMQRAWLEEMAGDVPDPSVIKYGLRMFTSIGTSVAAPYVLRDTRVWEIDPSRTSEYLSMLVATPGQQLTSEAIALLERTESPGIRLSTLRSLRPVQWGADEGAMIRSIATNPHDHPLVRAEALGLIGATPHLPIDLTVDLALSEEPTCMRRAATGSLRRLSYTAQKTKAARRIFECGHDTLAVTASWASGERM